ncbi:MAG: DUF5666 domain-containing protein [Pseudomonadales bacterium]
MSNNLLNLMILTLTLSITACGGGGGSSSSSAPTATTQPSIEVTNTRGVVSGGVGLADSNGVITGVGLVGVSGSGIAVGVSGSGVSLGTIQDFGSIVINDERIVTQSADFEIGGSPGSQSELRQGQQVLVIQDTNGEAVFVSYRANIVAPLDVLTIRDPILELGSAGALGQTIELNAATVYEGTELSALAVDYTVEISGIVAEDGSITATFVRELVGVSEFSLIGQATDVTDSAFRISGRLITYDASQLLNFSADGLVEDDVIEVKFLSGNVDPAATSLPAQSVELLDSLVIQESEDIDAEGLVTSLTSANEFSVQHQPVIVTTTTAVSGGVLDNIQVGTRAVVKGNINRSGVLEAGEIFIESDDTVLVEGPLEAIDLTAETLTLLGVTFQVRDLTDFDGFTSLDELAISDLIEVAGYVDGGSIVAADIEREDGDIEAEIRGPISDFDPTAGSLTIFDVEISSDELLSTFEGFSDESLTQTEFFDLLSVGVFVSASWDSYVSTSVTVDALSLEDD